MAKHKILIFRIVFMIFFVFMGFFFSESVIYEYEEGFITLKKEDITFLKGYEIDDRNQFKIVADDPQIVFDLHQSPIEITKVNIVLENHVKQNIPVQVFYRDNWTTFSEKCSASTMFSEGEQNLLLNFDNVKCTSIRLDMDGEFSLEAIQLTGSIGNINVFRTVGYTFCILILLFFLWKYISVKAGAGFFELITKISDGYTFLYEQIENFFSAKGVKIQHVFCLLAFFYGLSMAFLIPPNQVPDELTHYRQMVEATGFSQIEVQIEMFFDETGVSAIQGNPLEQVNRTLIQEHINDRFDKAEVGFTYPSVSIIKHFPATILFFVGYFLDFSIYHCLMMAEIGSLIFYVIMGYFTLKYMPMKKELMCAILLLPMTVQQCTSVNYDSVLIPVSLFFTAYVFYCKYEKEYAGWKDLILFMGLAYVVMKIKPTYFPMFLQVLLIPISKWNLKIGKKFDMVMFAKRFKLLFMLTGVLLFAALLYVGRNNTYIQLVEACFLRPDLVFVRIYHTLKELFGFYLMSMIADLGWLDTQMPVMFYIFVVVCLFLFGQQEQPATAGVQYRINRKEKIFIIFISLATLYLIFIAMFTWTMFLNDIDYGSTLVSMINAVKEVYISLGVQGRYFLPIAFLFFLPFDGLMKLNKKKLLIMQYIYYPVYIVWSLIVVLQRYWI